MQVAQELFQTNGMKFTNVNQVCDYCTELNGKWEADFVPSILQYSKELGIGTGGSNCDDGTSWFVLTVLLEKLRPRGTKLTVDDRLCRIICVSEVSKIVYTFVFFVLIILVNAKLVYIFIAFSVK
jgi:hypothetical protein